VARLTGLEPATPGVTGRYSNQLSYNRAFRSGDPVWVARLTGLEPATPGVTGRYSNQLSYNRAFNPPGSPPERGACNRQALRRRQAGVAKIRTKRRRIGIFALWARTGQTVKGRGFLSENFRTPLISFGLRISAWNNLTKEAHQLGNDYPVFEGLNDGLKTRKTGRYRAEASAG
jgi:hypothetical protein